MGLGSWLSDRWDDVKDGASYVGGKVADGASYVGGKVADGAGYVYNKAVDGTAFVIEKGLDAADHFTSSGHGATDAFMNSKTINNLADAGEFIQHGDGKRVAHAIFQGTKDGFGEILALPGDIIDLGNMGVKKLTGHGYDGSVGDWISQDLWKKPTDELIQDVSSLAGHEIKPFEPQTNGEAWAVGAYKSGPVIASFMLPGGAGKVGKIFKPFTVAAKDSKAIATVAKATSVVTKPLAVVAKPVETAVKTVAKIPGVTPVFKGAVQTGKVGLLVAMPLIYGSKEAAAFKKHKEEVNGTLDAYKSVDAHNAEKADKVLAEHNIPTQGLNGDAKIDAAKKALEADMTKHLRDMWLLVDPQNADKINNAVDHMSTAEKQAKLQELLALPDPQPVPAPATRPSVPAPMGR